MRTAVNDQVHMTNLNSSAAIKVPAVTLTFWIIKILATTLGETGGDAVSMSMNLGYLASTGIFTGIFIIAVIAQLSINRFLPLVYWATIIATTTMGTTLADFTTRSLGIGYAGGSMILVTSLALTLVAWHWSTGTIAVESVSTPKAEWFYWITIMFSQTLGTALGDWMADSMSLGYVGAALVFSAALVAVAVAHFFSRIPQALLFWAAFILTRPLGAVVGDFLDKPVSKGGLELSRYSASAFLCVLIVGCVMGFQQRAASKGH